MKITWQLAILLVSYPLSFSFKSILYSLLWETLTLTLQPTVPSPYIQASVNRRHWREGWKEREETASYLFSLIFFSLFFSPFKSALLQKRELASVFSFFRQSCYRSHHPSLQAPTARRYPSALQRSEYQSRTRALT